MTDFDLGPLHGPLAPESHEALADRAAVSRIPALYALGIDTRDGDLVQSLFAPDAVIRGVLGEEPAHSYIPKLIAGVTAYQATMHNITNQYVVLDGAEGTLWSYAVALQFEEPGNGRPDMAMGVHYRDRVARTGLGWWITERQTVTLWTRGPFPR
jgi:hypothetical protein